MHGSIICKNRFFISKVNFDADLDWYLTQKEVAKSRNRELGELFQSGFGIHHAGMLRSDRNLTERLFSEGLIKVFVSFRFSFSTFSICRQGGHLGEFNLLAYALLMLPYSGTA